MAYEQAPQTVINLVEAIINEYHPQLSGADIGVLFQEEATRKGGKVILGKARKAPPVLKAYEDLDFLIIIAKDQWINLTNVQRRALIDHELCHCVLEYNDDRRVISIRPHDVEEFNEIIDRHGLWTADLVKAAPKFEGAQRTLPAFEMELEHRGKVVAVKTDPVGNIMKRAADEFNKTNDPEKAHAVYQPGKPGIPKLLDDLEEDFSGTIKKLDPEPE